MMQVQSPPNQRLRPISALRRLSGSLPPALCALGVSSGTSEVWLHHVLPVQRKPAPWGDASKTKLYSQAGAIPDVRMSL